MPNTWKTLTLLGLLAVPAVAAELDRYNVVWDSPSKDSLDAMPLSGRLGAGANVWVQDGSLWLYLAHNAAYDENGRLLKLGCLRLTPEDKSLAAPAAFRQELDLTTGSIRIRADAFSATLWFAGETLVVETASGKPQALTVAFGTWRDRKRDGLKLDVWGAESIQPDKVVADASGIAWSHRNADYPFDLAGAAQRQGIPREDLYDPAGSNVFGGALAVEGGLSAPAESPVQWQFWEGKAWTGRTAERERHLLAVRLQAGRGGDPARWLAEAGAALVPAALAAARADEARQWMEFWSRSHVFINAAGRPDDAGWLIGRNYQLFRYMLACNRGGALPLLFNGGIFTVDNPPGRITGNNNNELAIAPGAPATPDFRRWMGCHFMSQNQRWLGWPTLAAGDADLLTPSLAFYRDRARTAAARARKHGAEGVVYPEPLDIWGLCCVAPRPDGLCGAEHLTYHFSMMLEHAWMALQAHDAIGISLAQDLPWIEGTVLFYDSFYRAACKKRTGKEVGDDGKLVIYPACGLEYAGGATDPVEVVAGLRCLTAGLLALQDLPEALRARLREIQGRLPELPVGRRRGRPSLLAARSLEREYNKWEPIEMYAAWPYRLVGVTRPGTLQLARDTWETIPADRARLCKQDFSWMANVANMAALALPAEARQRVIYKLANTTAPQVRFPAFFGPGHDWLPDHNWGGSGMVGLQEMLVAAEPGPTGKIYLFPAWPQEWAVDFRLHAPGMTVVEGVYRAGKLERLNVTPAARLKDVVNLLGKAPAYEPPPPALSQGKPAAASSTFHEPGYDPARAFDGNPATRWAAAWQSRGGWLQVDLGSETLIGRAWLSEVEWQETREFVIETRLTETGEWKELARGTTIGADKTLDFTPVKARFVRLRILKTERDTNINEFQLFAPEAASP